MKDVKDNIQIVPNDDIQKEEDSVPQIAEVELNYDESIVFFGSCHCSALTK